MTLSGQFIRKPRSRSILQYILSTISYNFHYYHTNTGTPFYERISMTIYDHLWHACMFFLWHQFLKGAGANLDLRGNFSKTALMIAASNGQYDVVVYLVEAGASLDLQDTPCNRTALMVGDMIISYSRGHSLGGWDMRDWAHSGSLQSPDLALSHLKFSVPYHTIYILTMTFLWYTYSYDHCRLLLTRATSI